MKTLQERFEENYAAVEKPASNKDGFKIEYVYYAPWYLWDCPEEKLKKHKRALLAASAVGLAFYILAGIQPWEANTALWIGGPALLGLCAHVVELFGLILFFFAKYRTTKMTYTDVNRMLTLAPPIRVGMMAFCAGFGAFFLVTLGFCQSGLIALAGYLISGITALYVSRSYRSLPLRTERNDTLEQRKAQGRLH